MTSRSRIIPDSIPSLEQILALRTVLRRRAYRRMSQALKRAKSVLFDDTSKLVFFSDLHRGDSSRSDAFARNEDLFLHALRYYFREGFRYIEVGDGDELWQNRRLSAVKRAHGRTFGLLHEFAGDSRLHMVFGNHDIRGFEQPSMKKDGLTAHEGLLLHHVRTDQRIFVVHGHQVDFKSDALYRISRFVSGNIWRHIQNLGFSDVATSIRESRNRGTLRKRVSEWIEAHSQMVICGHTHTPKFPEPGAIPYFNTGSGVFDGYITGLEIQHGRIAPVEWLQSERGQVDRRLLAPPLLLSLVT